MPRQKGLRDRFWERGQGSPDPALGQILSDIFINDPKRGSKQSVNEICRGY